jgi:glycosyltransferase involved in cell wall biosynthesis
VSPNLVVADATPYGPQPSGAKHRFLEVLPRLAALRPDDVFEVHWAAAVADPVDAPWPDNVVHAVVEGGPAGTARTGARRWVRRYRALRARHRSAAYTHLLVDHGPLPPLPGVRAVLTVHDLRFLHGWSGRLRAAYGRRAWGRMLARAWRIATVSASVGEEIARRWPNVADRVVVAPNAPSPRFAPDSSVARSREVLVVARDEPRKARGAALAAAAAAGWPIRVVGGDAEPGALLEAYRRATWLLAPSLEEGYDLPVVEALACGTPVIASSIEAHRELVARDARGLVLCHPPTRAAGAWNWPGAVARLGEPPPAAVAPPADDWGETAARLADALFARAPGPQ